SPLAHFLDFTGSFMKSGGEYYLYDIIQSFLEYTFGNLSESELLSRLLQRDDVRVFKGIHEIPR
ncbi:MAG TPA: hypothetical protein PK387_03240, partial [Mesotoga prima]|nr:hypothetical protein [Mesotoga prima]